MTSVLNVDTIADKAGTGPVGLTKQSAAKAWVNANGSATGAAARDSFNVSGMTDNATGDYTTSFSNSMNNANFSAVNSGGDGSNGVRASGAQTYATGSFRTYIRNTSDANTDALYYNLSVNGDLA
jgi:hypothetical protein